MFRELRLFINDPIICRIALLNLELFGKAFISTLEFDSIIIISPTFLVFSLILSNFLVIGDKDSANLISCVCFNILFLIFSAR